MHREVKVGIAIGVLVLALVGIFIWSQFGRRAPEVIPPEQISDNVQATVPPVSPAEAEEGSVALQGGAPATPATPRSPSGTQAPPTATAPAQGASPVPPSAPAVRTHTIQSGDTLEGIARKYYGDPNKWRMILDANKGKISDPARLKAGVVIEVPEAVAGSTTPAQGASPTAAASVGRAEKRHTVQAGDTLSSLANRYYGDKSKWRIIYNANRDRIKNPDVLNVGSVLVIPPAAP